MELLHGLYRDHTVYFGLYRDNGKENGNYIMVYIGIIIQGIYWGYIGLMEKEMETMGIIEVI